MTNEIRTTITAENAEVKLTDAEALDRYLELQNMIEELQKEADALKAQLKEATAAEPERKQEGKTVFTGEMGFSVVRG